VFIGTEPSTISDSFSPYFWGGIVAPIAASIGLSFVRGAEWSCVGLVIGAVTMIAIPLLPAPLGYLGEEGVTIGLGYWLNLPATASLILFACALGHRVGLGFASVRRQGWLSFSTAGLLTCLAIGVGNEILNPPVNVTDTLFAIVADIAALVVLILMCLIATNNGVPVAQGRMWLVAVAVGALGLALLSIEHASASLLGIAVVATAGLSISFATGKYYRRSIRDPRQDPDRSASTRRSTF
jgi:hypothetical protein